MLHITEEDVLKHYSMKQCMKDVEKAFSLSKTTRVDIPFRTILHHNGEGAHTLYMPSYIEDIQYASIKISSLFPSNKEIPMIQSLIVLTETISGKHVATLSASALTMLRTGAISGIGTKYLSRKNSEVLSVIGCGAQSFGQVQAIMEVRDITKIILYNRTTDKAELLSAKIFELYSSWAGEVIIMEDANDAVKAADIVVSCTSADTPVFSGKCIKKGTHINAIGSCAPNKHEYDVHVLNRASKVVVDTFEGAKNEAGGLLIPHNNNEWSLNKIYGELSDVILEQEEVRNSADDITLLDSVGVGFLDTICAASIYTKIKEIYK